MIPMVAFPDLVEHYGPYFEYVFSAEALIEFNRYIGGLMVSENKTVDGINRLCVMENRNQSSLNRLLTQSPFVLDELNAARLRLLAAVPGTQMKAKGVLGIDDTLLTHYGQGFEQIAKLYDHTTNKHTLSHAGCAGELGDSPYRMQKCHCSSLSQTYYLEYGPAAFTLLAQMGLENGQEPTSMSFSVPMALRCACQCLFVPSTPGPL